VIEHPVILFVVFPLAAYVVGATPFGVIIARAHGVDLRRVGSGNVGATNVARVIGRRWGYLCFALDWAKGFAPVLAVGILLGATGRTPAKMHQAVWLAVGCGTILGHVFSFWLKFRGGKGVATSLGVVIGVFPYFTWAGLAALALWILVTLTSRYISLGSIVAAAAFLPLFAGFSFALGWPPADLWPLMAFAAAMAALIILRHRSNISRLMAGTESKIGAAKAGHPGAGESAAVKDE